MGFVTNIYVKTEVFQKIFQLIKNETKRQIFILERSAQNVPPLHELEEMNEKQQDESLSRFYTEARDKKGEEYSKSSLISLSNAIERYLNSPPFMKIFKLNSAAFTSSNRMSNAKIIRPSQCRI